jgi:hypothetical protein
MALSPHNAETPSGEGGSVLKQYLKQIHDRAIRGDAREESYYSALEALLKAYAAEKGIRADVTTLPKKTEAGNPDFRVWSGKIPLGYLEAKDPRVEDLDAVENGEQLKRYRHTFPNLILTNFLEFRLYREGERIARVTIARPFILNRIKTIPPLEKEELFLSLLEKFFDFFPPKLKDAKTLAVELAKRTRFLRDEVIALELEEEASGKSGSLIGFYEAFKKYLISGLSKEEFADLYSQTVAYGFFAARTRAEGDFDRRLAYDRIPHTIGVLRDVFRFISMGDLPKPMEWIIDDISQVLAATDVKAILHRFYKEGKGKDPIVHFYETFLAEYDPRVREMRGVYYTPEPVVSYIVRSLHNLLKEKFNRPDGLADGSVTVLDPAAGTLTFPAEAAALAVKEFSGKYGEGGKKKFITGHLLKDFYAFELMMAPYAIGHLKIAFLLEELGYRLGEDDRFKLYLTNTLEMDEIGDTRVPGLQSLAEESHLAGEVKTRQPILVIMGNPPYSGHSSNTGKWITEEIKAYKMVDGKPLGEKNPKWLQDDYVKFIRFAQWKIDEAGEGMVGMITNHSYLDNPTFRGMRRSLMTSFNEIHLLDLHGNSLKKERCPDGSEDKNVFDIRQGVAIALFVKRKGQTGCRVFHADLWGKREKKYEWLEGNDLDSTKWSELSPSSEAYLYIPRDERLARRYERYPRITDIFPVNSVGVVTARDALTIRKTPEEVWNTVQRFARMEPELARQAYDLGKDARDWKVELAQKDLRDSGPEGSGPVRKKIVPILYRPFDTRFTYYTGKSRGFICMPRPEVMQHMLKRNLGLVLPKRVEIKGGWQHVLVSGSIVEHVTVSLKTIDYLFPLYLGSNLGEELFPNLGKMVMQGLTSAYGSVPGPEKILGYVYGLLFAESYRKRYGEFLRADFPRIPFAKGKALFLKIAALGEGLIGLHLLTSPELDRPIARFQGGGDTRVEKVSYDAGANAVRINPGSFFEGVPAEVWEYQVGGYQVCDKWLKDRKGEILTLDEIKHYCRVVTALAKTIEIQQDLDALYPEVEKDVIEFGE